MRSQSGSSTVPATSAASSGSPERGCYPLALDGERLSPEPRLSAVRCGRSTCADPPRVRLVEKREK
jgi:hypothetical protein